MSINQYIINNNLVTIIGENHQPKYKKSKCQNHSHVPLTEILKDQKNLIVFLEVDELMPTDSKDILNYNSINVKDFARYIFKNKVPRIYFDIRKQIFGYPEIDLLINSVYYNPELKKMVNLKPIFTYDNNKTIYESLMYYIVRIFNFLKEKEQEKEPNKYLKIIKTEIEHRCKYVQSGLMYHRDRTEINRQDLWKLQEFTISLTNMIVDYNLVQYITQNFKKPMHFVILIGEAHANDLKQIFISENIFSHFGKCLNIKELKRLKDLEKNKKGQKKA